MDKVIAEKKKEPIGTKEAEQEVATDLNEAAHRDTQGVRHTQEAKKTMQAKHPNRDGSKAPRSRKGLTDEAKADHDRQRQHDHAVLIAEALRVEKTRLPAQVLMTVC